MHHDFNRLQALYHDLNYINFSNFKIWELLNSEESF